jgi:copper resistance protein D
MERWMSGFAAEINGPMVAVRAVHFAATAVIAGALMFRAVVVDSAMRGEDKARLIVCNQIRRLAWIALALSVVSAALWLLLQSSAMSGQTYLEAMASGALFTVLDNTQFGWVFEVRLALAIALAICLVLDRRPWPRWLALGAAQCLVAAIAWTGHAASTPFKLGYLHLTADALHLCAAAAWTGGLAALVLLLTDVNPARMSSSIRLDAVRRFSALGMVGVATLLVSGIVNAWILVGSFRALFKTDYGWVLMAKLAIFAAMVVFAAVNRFWLMPRLGAQPDAAVVRNLRRNSMFEFALASAVFAAVGVLGTQHPAAHFMN